MVALALIVGLLVGCFTTCGVMQYSANQQHGNAQARGHRRVHEREPHDSGDVYQLWHAPTRTSRELFGLPAQREQRAHNIVDVHRQLEPSNASNYLTLTWN